MRLPWWTWRVPRPPAAPPRAGEAAPRSVHPLTRREIGAAVLSCALAATLFLGRPLLSGRILSPAAMLFAYPPWQTVAPPAWPGAENALLGDSALQFEPWLALTAARLHAGSLPLWNPDNMLGAPLLGNMQSGLFSPLNWPYFLWPDPTGLVLRVWLKLFLAALGVYLLAREVARVGPLPAAVAGLTFTYGAFMVVWALHPQTAVVVWLPWLWWRRPASWPAQVHPPSRSWGCWSASVYLAVIPKPPFRSC